MAFNKKIAIVAYTRTPFDRFGGWIKEIPSHVLGQKVIKDVVEKVKLPKEEVGLITYGTAIHAEIGPYVNVPVRQALLNAGFPSSTLSLTVDRACCSSMTGMMIAIREMQAGEIDVAIVAGAENLSNIPHLAQGLRWGKKLGSLDLYDVAEGFNYPGFGLVTVDTDNVSRKYGVTREEMDKWAYRSHMAYKKASDENKFADEIIPYSVKNSKGEGIIIDSDQSFRPDTSLEKLARLDPVYGTETITAGNAPGLNAGAAALLIMTEKKAKALGMKILAYINDFTSVASDAENIPVVPAEVVQKLLQRNNLTIEDIDLFEINEAFAAMPLVSTKILAGENEKLLEQLRERTNVNGGAIAIGHPMGATGVRVIMALVNEMRRRGGGKGIACLCGGLAQGDGVMVEVLK